MTEKEITITYQLAKLTDLDELMAIEQADFKPSEASSREGMLQRIRLAAGNFIVAHDQQDSKVIGFICGATSSNRHLSDNHFENIRPSQVKDKFQLVTSLAIHPDYQGLGIGTELIERLVLVAKEHGRTAISLTCLAELISYYEVHHFVNEGISKSKLAGEVWYNMVREL